MLRNDLFWLAGFLEGEGSFIFQRFGLYKQRSKFTITATSCDKDIIERAAKIMNANINGPYVRAECPNRKPQWKVNIARRYEVLELCRQLLPHMGERRQKQIWVLLEADLQYPPASVVENPAFSL